MRLAFPHRIVPACCAAILGAAVASTAAPALAGSAVTPTLVRLASPRQTGEVTFWNGGKTAVLVEASAVSWQQVDGRDVFAPTDDMVIAPMIVRVPPASGQIFRVRQRTASSGGAERTYRLRLEDITPAQPGGGVGLRVRHDLPLIVAGGGTPQWAFAPCPARAADCLRVANRGAALGKITSLSVQVGADAIALSGTATILPGSWHEWTLPRAVAGQTVQVRADTDHGTITDTIAKF